jgi:hypothetical protein
MAAKPKVAQRYSEMLKYCWKIRTKITLCELKSHFACKNHTHACENLTPNVEITLVRVKTTFGGIEITICVSLPHLCVPKLHSAYQNHTRACQNHTLRMNITLSMFKSQSRLSKSHSGVPKLHSSVSKSHFA